MLDRERLARVLGMLGPAHDGEALAAARQAERLRSEARLTWLDILIPALPQPHGQTVADAIACVLDHDEMLTNWEAPFVRSIGRQRHVEVNGKRQYAPILEWRDRDRADRFSAAVVALVREACPDALGGSAT